MRSFWQAWLVAVLFLIVLAGSDAQSQFIGSPAPSSTISALNIDTTYLSPPLQFDFYATSCPEAPAIVSTMVMNATSYDFTVAPQLLRMFFHDCIVQGCDASLLLNSTLLYTNSPLYAEKDFQKNDRFDKFSFVDLIKQELESVCPGVVSCADILAMAAVSAIAATQGPEYQIELGRRDGLSSYQDNAQTHLPGFYLNVSGLLDSFNNAGLDIVDLVALSGAHTIGQGHCDSIQDRLQSPPIYPIYPSYFLNQMKTVCQTPDGTFDNNVVAIDMDVNSTFIFDNGYYKGLIAGVGLFTSDQFLYTDPRTMPLVELFAQNQELFFQQFGVSLRKMGKINVLTGMQGQIRQNCWVRNSNTADVDFLPRI
ncbi:unnamed protein product [Sphagnum troendelagicum]